MKTNLTSSFYPSTQKQLYQIIFEQDAVFSGFEYLNSILEISTESSDIAWHTTDGECILEGQTCMEVFQGTKDLDEHIKKIAYFSGISTLARCYTASLNHASISGTPEKDSPLFQWEVKALSHGGVNTQPTLPEKICYSEKDLNLDDSIIALSTETPLDELKQILKKIPANKTKGVYGPILPKDLNKFNELPINVIWPELLQGCFPSVKIKTHGNE